MTTSAVRFVGGMVAHNEERRVGRALRSLLEQELPAGTAWSEIFLVASGCTDRTAAIGASVDPRVRVIIEAERNGKASALRLLYRTARERGDFLVYLNADAEAAPGAVRALWDSVRGREGSLAVMGRPRPGPRPASVLSQSLDLLWELHHRLYRDCFAEGDRPYNSSDELLLLPTGSLPDPPEFVINDGGFLGAWLGQGHGTAHYAPDAVVTIDVPSRFRDYVAQRRRIRFGLGDMGRRLGVAPLTLGRYLRRHPRQALRMVLSAVRDVPNGWRALTALVMAELLASLAATKDRWWGGTDHRRWAMPPDA